MTRTTPKPGAPGTTEQRPRREGPPENRPRGYLPPLDDPIRDADAFGETEADGAEPGESGAGKPAADNEKTP